MICEIINPSDPYTLVCDDFICAAVVIALLGDGQLGLGDETGELDTPLVFGWEDWFVKQGIKNIDKYTKEHLSEMADILDTVLIGSAKDRVVVDLALKKLSPDDGKKWLLERHDIKRSSLNDIGRGAWELAENLRTQLEEK